MLHGAAQAVDPCKVAIYIRWSTDDQGEGTTLDVQLEGCRHYALSQGWAVAESLTFIDDGHSGGTLNRPALGRLRQAVSRGDVECVVVYKLDRLSRDVPDMIRLILDEWDGRCYVKSAREPIDTTTQTGRMFFYTLASYAEWERSVIKDRTFSGKLRRAQEGKSPGMRLPYGYAKGESTGTFQMVPHEAEVVRRIYSMYLNGYGMVRIADTLNAESIPFREGRTWSLSTLRHVLSNEAYKGVLVYGKLKTDSKRKTRRKNPEPYVTVPGVFPVIVEPGQWDLVQAVKHKRPAPSNGGSGRAVSSKHLLTGFLKCPQCGYAVVAHSNSFKGWRYDYYVCSGVLQRGGTVCDARRIRQEVLNEIVVRKVKELYGTELARRSYLEAVSEDWRAKEEAVRGGLAEVEEALSKTEGRRKKLRLMLLDGHISPDEFRAFQGDIEDEAKGLEDQQRHLAESLRHIQALRAQQASLSSAVARLDQWETLSKVEQKELLRRFIDSIEVHSAKGARELACNIVWRVAQESPVSTVIHTMNIRERVAIR